MRVLLVNAGAKNHGATQEILDTVRSEIECECDCNTICLGEKDIRYCLGCKACYETGRCVRHDDVETVFAAMDAADALVIAAPSYWADLPGQFKVFIDRCTVYGDTNPHPLHPVLKSGKKCYAVALRAGTRPAECEHILEGIRHWCGHMKIETAGSLFFCGIDGSDDILPYRSEISQKAREWFGIDQSKGIRR